MHGRELATGRDISPAVVAGQKRVSMPNKLMRSCLAIALSAVMVAFAGCSGEDGSEPPTPTVSESADQSAFSYSDGIDSRGFWDGVTATDYVVLPDDYDAIQVSAAAHEVTEEAINTEIEALLSSYKTESSVTDRAVVNGDKVNIDYVGSVGGVPFNGGSTDGAGTDVTIGETQYIDDFLEQIIGHVPGDTFNVEVTFPENYGVDALNGQDAVFVTTVNYISQTLMPELTDAFVAENLSATRGWTTVQAMRDGVADGLKRTAVRVASTDYLQENSIVAEIPDAILEYQVKALILYYQSGAVSYGLEYEEFLNTYAGVATEEELISNNEESNFEKAKYSLIMQAVAERQKISGTDEDIASYFAENAPNQDVAQMESFYGKPYIMQVVLQEQVTAFLTDHAILG
jgi:trigger factor